MLIVCVLIAYPCVDGDVRLVGGNHDNEGSLEVCTKGVWKVVCTESISSAQVDNICASIAGPNVQGTVKPVLLIRSPFGQVKMA